MRGFKGEKIAFGWLKKAGFNVILKNYHSRFGEIDLIATLKDKIYFIEVKLREFNSDYSPGEAVDVLKQKKLIKTAVIFLSKHRTKLQPVFSVIEILIQSDGAFKIRFIENAFSVENELEIFSGL